MDSQGLGNYFARTSGEDLAQVGRGAEEGWAAQMSETNPDSVVFIKDNPV